MTNFERVDDIFWLPKDLQGHNHVDYNSKKSHLTPCILFEYVKKSGQRQVSKNGTQVARKKQAYLQPFRFEEDLCRPASISFLFLSVSWWWRLYCLSPRY